MIQEFGLNLKVSMMRNLVHLLQNGRALAKPHPISLATSKYNIKFENIVTYKIFRLEIILTWVEIPAKLLELNTTERMEDSIK